MKRLMLILIAMFVLIVSSCSRQHGYIEVYCSGCDGHIVSLRDKRIFNADYIVEYGDVLNTMFDHEWTLLSVEERLGAPFVVCHHVHLISAHQYLEWTVEYRDGNGEIRHFVFHNREDLFSQTIYHIEDYISAYYQEHFVDIYMENILLLNTSPYARPSVRVGSMLLETLDDTIHLSQLSPATVFELLPIYLSIIVLLDDYADSDRQAFEESALMHFETMIDTMNHFTNNHLNADVRLRYLRHTPFLYCESRYHRRTYIQGERDFDLEQVFQSPAFRNRLARSIDCTK
ncbi:MAG: hypothetical protein FWD84_04425 [Oscillospiraceae bacterium]|nr:hypothetical protein [Oscillospiraceae bacterium]